MSAASRRRKRATRPPAPPGVPPKPRPLCIIPPGAPVSLCGRTADAPGVKRHRWSPGRQRAPWACQRCWVAAEALWRIAMQEEGLSQHRARFRRLMEQTRLRRIATAAPGGAECSMDDRSVCRLGGMGVE